MMKTITAHFTWAAQAEILESKMVISNSGVWAVFFTTHRYCVRHYTKRICKGGRTGTGGTGRRIVQAGPDRFYCGGFQLSFIGIP